MAVTLIFPLFFHLIFTVNIFSLLFSFIGTDYGGMFMYTVFICVLLSWKDASVLMCVRVQFFMCSGG